VRRHVAALALQALAVGDGSLPARRRLTRNQHVLLRLGDLSATPMRAAVSPSAPPAMADAAAIEKSHDPVRRQALAAMSRVFAREAAQKVGQEGARWVAGSADAGQPRRWPRCWQPFPATPSAPPRPASLADMDRTADILYARAA
jgi:alkylation response protein AidB-like acyl-CoA dehydrogenase